MAECAMSERAATQAVDYVRRGVEALGAIPDENTIVVERFFDGLGGTQIVIHTPFGIRSIARSASRFANSFARASISKFRRPRSTTACCSR